MNAGIHRIGASSASIIGLTGVVATLFLAWLLLEEPLTVMQMAGTVMILSGITFVARGAVSPHEQRR